MSRAFFVLFVLFFALCSGQPSPRKQYKNQIDLTSFTSENTYYNFYYNVTQTELHACVVADVGGFAGWAAIGFSNTGEMVYSDVAMAYVETNFTSYVTDFWLSGKLAPTARLCQLGYASTCPDSGRNGSCVDNLSNTFAQRTGQYLLMEFTRPLAASDSCDIAVPLERPVTIVFGVGPVVVRYEWPYKAQFHSSHGRYNHTFKYIPVTTGILTTGIPTTGIPTTGNPTTGELTTGVPPAQTTGVLTTGNPTTGVPTTGNPTTGVPTTGNPTTGVPTTGISTTGVIPAAIVPVLFGYQASRNLTDNFADPSTGKATTNYYGLYYSISNGILSVGIVAEVSDGGWLSIGLSKDGKMVTENSTNDAIIAWIDGTGVARVGDFNIKGTVNPSQEHCSTSPIDSVCPDNTQGCVDNILSSSVIKDGKFMILKFTRKLDTGDKCDLKITPGQQQFILFAVGPTTSQEWPYNIQYHDKYSNGQQPLIFTDPTPVASSSTCTPGNPNCKCTSLNGCVPGYQCTNSVCVQVVDASPSVVLAASFLLALFLF